MKFFRYDFGIADASLASAANTLNVVVPVQNVLSLQSGDVSEGELIVKVAKPGDSDGTESLKYKVVGVGDAAVDAAMKDVSGHLVSAASDIISLEHLPTIEGVYLKMFDIVDPTTLALDEDVVVVVGSGVSDRPTAGSTVEVMLVEFANSELNYNKQVNLTQVNTTAADLTFTFESNVNHPSMNGFEASDQFKVVVKNTTSTNPIGRTVISSSAFTFTAS